MTYAELNPLVRRWAAGVRAMGLQRGSILCIAGENCLEWALLDWACQCLGVVLVPIYPTLPRDQAEYLVQDCGAETVICGDAKQYEKLNGIESKFGGSVRTVFLKDGENSVRQFSEESPILSEPEWSAEIDRIQPDDLATLIYTSGTTGKPKGARLLHRNFVYMNRAVQGNIPVGKEDIFLSFLPLSHVFERANGHFLPISLGATIGYCRSLASLATDFQSIRPTLMLTVPRIQEAMMDRILDSVKKQSGLKQKLFQSALAAGKRRLEGKAAPFSPVLDRLVGEKVRARLGGRFRFFVSGGAAMPRHVYDFFYSFGISIQQGYGLTETTSGICLNNPDHPNRPETVGELFVEMECKIASDGEILLRGPAIFDGYHGLPEETAAAIDSDRWFHTGDIGVLEGTYLKITDRKKDLIISANGKNIAPQPIENKLRVSPLISEAVLFGDNMDSVVALILPNYEAIRAKIGSDAANEALAVDPQVRALVKAEVDGVNKTLATFEMVRRHTLLAQPFSIENGELTPSLKVKRKVVGERYADIIRSMG